MEQDFWRDSGWALLDHAPDGRLTVTDAYLAAYVARPELAPPEDACAAEKALFAALTVDPRAPIDDAALDAVADPDGRENLAVFRAHRARLLGADTLEAAYLGAYLAQDPPPALFAAHMAQAILRDALDATAEPFRARAGEIFFRDQKASVDGGRVMLADHATVDMLSATGGFGDLGRLIAEAQTPLRQVSLDVLTVENAQGYWARSERFDTVLDLTFGQPGLDALARCLELWVKRFLDLDVSAQPVAQIRDEKWRWHVGLDAESTRILNALYAGEALEDAVLARILALFRLEFAEPSVLTPQMAGRPVYLGLAMDADGLVRMKPQNLLVNLPLAERA